MKILELLTPISDVRWLATTDTVADALDHMETYGITAVPLTDGRARRAEQDLAAASIAALEPVSRRRMREPE
jgi:hypothetical protein